MANPNIYFSSGSSRIPRPPTSGERNILPYLASIHCETQCHPYLDTEDNTQNISVQFMHSCSSQDTTQLDSDILQQRLTFDHEASGSMGIPTVGYPESSQRTTTYALSPYATDGSRSNNFSACDLSTLHIVDAPLSHTRRCSWPSHQQTDYSTWMQTPQRTTRSPASEPPESTSDESYQDSDGDEATQMSPMMNEFQIESSQNVDPPARHMYHAQALRPSVMTFQLSETVLQPVDDPEDRRRSRRLLEMNVVTNEESESTHPAPPSTFRSSGLIPFGGATPQGPSMRPQHGNERLIRTNQYRVPVASSSVPFPSPHSPTNARVGDQRTTGSKQPKRSKMHQCEQCNKMFPRPSGLATHMNSHSGAKPYKCIVANCDKSFAVRSNAKRHLRTHGINPSSTDALSIPRFTVGFEEPMVTQVHDAGRQPSRYRWIPQSPSSQENDWGRQGSSSSAISSDSRTGLTFQTSTSSATSSTLSSVSEDGYEQVRSASIDVNQYRGNYSCGADEFSGSYPNYGEHARHG